MTKKDSRIHYLKRELAPVALLGKCRPPTLSRSVILRESLNELAHKILDHRLTELVAFAGAGKTEILKQWYLSLQGSQTKVAWISVDRSFNELPIFQATILKSFALALSTDTDQDLDPVPVTQLGSRLSQLINSLSGYDEKIVLFVDGYDAVVEDDVHNAFEQFVNDLPENVCTVITTRSPLPWSLGKLRLSEQMFTLTYDDIRLSRDEVLDFVVQFSPVKLDDKLEDELVRFADGWIAALKVTVFAFKREHNQRQLRRIIRGHNKALHDYLDENLFSTLSPNAKTLLITCAPFPQLKASFCEAVCKLKSCKEALNELTRGRLLVEYTDCDSQWYRLQSTQATFLRRQFEQLPSAVRREIYELASEWFLENHFPRDAVRYTLAIDDYKAVARILKNHCQSMMIDGDIEILAVCIDLLPKSELSGHPLIMLIFSWVLVISQRYDEADQMLQDLKEVLARSAKLSDALHSEIVDLDDNLRVLEYRIRQAVDPDWADCSVWETLRNSQPKNAYFVRQHIELALATAYLRTDRYSDAYGSYMEVRRCGESTNHLITTVSATVRMAQIRQTQGRLQDARNLCDEALSLVRGLKNPQAPVAGIAYLIRAQIHFELNSIKGSQRDLALARAQMRRFNLATYVVPADILSARITYALQGPGAALAELQTADHMPAHHKQRSPLDAVWAARTWYLTQTGDFDTAESILRNLGMPLDKKGPSPAFSCSVKSEFHYAAFCLFLIRTGRHYTASAWLTKLIHQAESKNRYLSRIGFGALLTLCHLCSENKDRAMRDLRETLLVAEKIGSLRSIVDTGPELTDLIQKFDVVRDNQAHQSERGPSKEFIDSLLNIENEVQAHSVEPIPGSTDIGGPLSKADNELLASLTSRELEVLTHLSDGLSNREIAEELMIGDGTIKWHIKNVYSKMDVNSRTQAAAKARMLRLVT